MPRRVLILSMLAAALLSLSGCGGSVTCCDGTVSGCPVISSGCCSHHGGVCGGPRAPGPDKEEPKGPVARRR